MYPVSAYFVTMIVFWDKFMVTWSGSKVRVDTQLHIDDV